MNDNISRQAAIDVFYLQSDDDGWWCGTIEDMETLLKGLPPAEQKTGEWLEKKVIHTDEAKKAIEEWQSCKCSACGRYDTRPYMYYFSEPRFCSWCGVKMKGEKDG